MAAKKLGVELPKRLSWSFLLDEAKRHPESFRAALVRDPEARNAFGRLVRLGCEGLSLLSCARSVALFRIAASRQKGRQAEQPDAVSPGELRDYAKRFRAAARAAAAAKSRISGSALYHYAEDLAAAELPLIDPKDGLTVRDVENLTRSARLTLWFLSSLSRAEDELREVSGFIDEVLLPLAGVLRRPTEDLAREQEVVLVRYVERWTKKPAMYADLARILNRIVEIYVGEQSPGSTYSEAALKMRVRRWPKSRKPIDMTATLVTYTPRRLRQRSPGVE